MSGQSQIPIFGFPIVKIVAQGQLCQQLIKLVVHTCFRFSACKNGNAGTVVPAAGQAGYTYVFSLFRLYKS